ncbi:MAG: alpha-glucan family phosphorylase [Thermodesulfovibrionales bacterium]|nr:alpha-glucan family phosphorylase [Thermodesulfovibrionales bacterium]MDP3111147.1 alpha-glucan family phosphorylase [Thermodesulfovibrionales bacterium]
MDPILTQLNEFIKEPKIAYFSMEIGLANDIPTYSGGLGVLAGDTIKSGADLKLPMVAVTLLSKKGYFTQEIDERGRQSELPTIWEPSNYMALLPSKVYVQIEGRDVAIQAWLYVVKSLTGGNIPVFFLDADIQGNSPDDRELTAHLYGGDLSYRLKQEIILGIGGVKMLHELGFEIKKYHMNEGHAALLTIELLLRYKRPIEDVWDERLVWDVDRVKGICVFTTHTPVEAGHDKFSYDLVSKIMGEPIPIDILKSLGGKDNLNMTLLAINLSEFINGVAKKHGEVSKHMFPGYEISAITNGVHSFTWTCDSLKKLYDKYLPGWANEPELFVRVGRIPDEELWAAHIEAKKILIDFVNAETNAGLDHETLTIGFARRATAYKRADLIFSDMERLEKIATGKIQIIYSGKAHPKDDHGKWLIEKIHVIKEKLKGKIKMAYVKNYDMEKALKLVAGVDVWLNTPLRPREASGTSGMKAAHNGVMNFSVLDGWWIEGHIEGFTGWAIGPSPTEIALTDNVEVIDKRDADDLYAKLETILIPMYYNDRHTWIRMMQNAIGKNAYYFNCHRMMRRYVTEAYIR